MNTIAKAPTAEPMTLIAADSYRLAATRYRAQGQFNGHLVIAGATGVPQRFYRRFEES